MWDPSYQTLTTFTNAGLETAPHSSMVELRIPESSKTFLTTIGLPREAVLLCRFELELNKLPTLREYAEQRGRSISSGEMLRRIGTDGRLQICISEENSSGNVIAVDLDEKHITKMVNTSVELLGGFLALYVEYCKSFHGSSDNEMDEGARKMESFMRDHDSTALNSPDSWWSLITEQMKNGLL